MTGFLRASSRSAITASGLAGALLICVTPPASAQQLGTPVQSASRPIATEVVVEYATIGGIQLSVPILRPDGMPTNAGGQVASNRQTGIGNATEILQAGRGNNAALQMTGSFNTGRIDQQGLNNVGQGMLTGNGLKLDLQQVGNGNQADLSLNGPSGGRLSVSQNGNGNNANLSVPAGRDVTVSQIGNGLSADVSQIGVQKSISIVQIQVR